MTKIWHNLSIFKLSCSVIRSFCSLIIRLTILDPLILEINRCVCLMDVRWIVARSVRLFRITIVFIALTVLLIPLGILGFGNFRISSLARHQLLSCRYSLFRQNLWEHFINKSTSHVVWKKGTAPHLLGTVTENNGLLGFSIVVRTQTKDWYMCCRPLSFPNILLRVYHLQEFRCRRRRRVFNTAITLQNVINPEIFSLLSGTFRVFLGNRA